MAKKKVVVDTDKAIQDAAYKAVKVIREGAKKADIYELKILRVVTKMIYSDFDVTELKS
ncbi:MAG: hypothetical protein E3K37_01550 [Candidatus Kuenenia sp.]|nr:hypothetical protein [Candidatus Kuenenia hertensis]